jgi:hypothetical protein
MTVSAYSAQINVLARLTRLEKPCFLVQFMNKIDLNLDYSVMKRMNLCKYASFLLLLRSVVVLHAQLLPQDNWYYSGLVITGNFSAIAIGPDDNIYMSTNDSAVSVFKTDGTFVRQFGSNMAIAGIAVSADTNIFVLDLAQTTNLIKRFSPTGQLLLQFSSMGTNDDQINPVLTDAPGSFCMKTGHYVTGIAAGISNRIYVADTGNTRVQVYDQSGTWIKHWGGPGPEGLPYALGTVSAVATAGNGNVAVRSRWANGDLFFYSFDFDGSYIGVIDGYGGNYYGCDVAYYHCAYSPDGLLLWDYVGNQGDCCGPHLRVSDPFVFWNYNSFELGFIRGDPNSFPPFDRNDWSRYWKGVAFDGRGTLYIATSRNYFYAARRIYGTDAGLTSASLPQPYILSVAQRPSSSVVDITYEVLEPGSNTVASALIAFVNGTNSLSGVQTMSLFAEGTATNIGPNTPANQVQHIAWDASEATTNFLNLQFEALANDGRGMLAFNFVTVPANGTNAAFTMSRSGVSDSDLLSIWYWLIATNDRTIVLTNGTVVGLTGSYSNQVLAADVSTTALGRSNLYQRLGVRAPTAAEIARATKGNYGFLSVSANNLVKAP